MYESPDQPTTIQTNVAKLIVKPRLAPSMTIDELAQFLYESLMDFNPKIPFDKLPAQQRTPLFKHAVSILSKARVIKRPIGEFLDWNNTKPLNDKTDATDNVAEKIEIKPVKENKNG